MAAEPEQRCCGAVGPRQWSWRETLKDDRTLIQEFTEQGSRAAFEILVRRHVHGMRRMLYGIFSGNREDMEDAEQEILLALFQNLGRFRGEASFKTYLYRLCRNKSIDLLRRKGRERRVLRSYSEDRALLLLPGASEDPEEMAVRSSERTEILECLRKLDRDERTVVILKDLEGLPMKEISRIMAIPVGTVKSRLHRSREKLVQLIEGRERCAAEM